MSDSTYSADVALAEALARLKAVEEDNLGLKAKLKQLVGDARVVEKAARVVEKAGGSAGGGPEMERLRKQNSELMHVNNQWDLQYKELEEAFRRYRIDSQTAQGENHTFIAKLKETKDRMSEEIRELQLVVSRKDKELSELRTKFRGLEEKLRGSGDGGARYGKAVVSHDRLRELEEESHMLRQQLKAYQDDFQAERRDRERMNEEKESTAIRYEAELTSLKLQLDRCRNELAHYTAEANRLSQQLRLKSQIEEEQYKRHLESNGYITRAPNLPPLDPFVEIDVEDVHPVVSRAPVGSHSPARQPSPRLLTRGVDLVQAYSNSQGAQAYSSNAQSVSSTGSQDPDRSRSPIMKNGGGSNYHLSPVPSSPLSRRSASPVPSPQHMTNADHAPNSRPAGAFRPNFPPSMTNGHAYPTPQAPHQQYPPPTHKPLPHTNGIATPHDRQNGYHMDNTSPMDIGMVAPASQNQTRGRSAIPPLETKGRYSCPRCERKFESKKICNDHKARCIL